MLGGKFVVKTVLVAGSYFMSMHIHVQHLLQSTQRQDGMSILALCNKHDMRCKAFASRTLALCLLTDLVDSQANHQQPFA